jgi:hypothetical protein
MLSPSIGHDGERESLCSLPIIRPKEIKKDLCSCTDTPDQYIQAFISVIQTFRAWRDIMLLLDQTLSSLEKQRVLA